MFCIICMTIGVLLFLVKFKEYKIWPYVLIGLICLSMAFLLYLSTTIKKRTVKFLVQQIHGLLENYNQSFFMQKRLYIMPSNDMKNIGIYIIPPPVNAGVLIHNRYLDLSNKINNFAEDSCDEELEVNAIKRRLRLTRTNYV
jgi:hypothetical protein